MKTTLLSLSVLLCLSSVPALAGGDLDYEDGWRSSHAWRGDWRDPYARGRADHGRQGPAEGPRVYYVPQPHWVPYDWRDAHGFRKPYGYIGY